MSNPAAPTIVVGTDISEGAQQATDWAAADAATRPARIRLVLSYETMVLPWTMTYPAITDQQREQIDQAARSDVEAEADRVRKADPELTVTAEAVDGPAVPTLLAAAHGAAALVIGSRQLGSVGSTVLGSVGNGLAGSADCPVVVVRGPAGDGGTVVAGVDGSPTSDAVLEYAFDHAQRHGLGVRAVLCWPHTVATLSPWTPDLPVPDEAQQSLSDAIAPFVERYPGVTAEIEVRHERPVDGLVAAAEGENLLVVGTHGRGPVAKFFLGSVSRGVLHHATGPVVVVPPVTSPDADRPAAEPSDG